MDTIKELRKNKGLTMKQLGINIGVAESTISLYESGKRQPDIDTLIKLADFFDVSLDYLLGRAETMSTEDAKEKAPSEKTELKTIKFAARNGGMIELALSDEQIENLKQQIDALPDATDL